MRDTRTGTAGSRPTGVGRVAAGVAATAGVLALSLAGAQPGTADTAATGPVLSVNRTTGLLDGDIVKFGIAGGPPKAYVWVEQCVATAAGTVCDEDTGRQFRVYPDGTYQVSPKKLYTQLHTAAGDFDCRTPGAGNECRLALTDNAGAVLTTVPLGFRPHGRPEPAPTLRVTPDTGLTEGQTVHLSGQRYEPQYHIPVLECLAGSADTLGCRPGSRPPATTDQGRINQDLSVSASFTTIDGRAVDCRTKDVCELIAFGSRVHGPDAVRHPVSFAPVP
ncbi:neocarzinostatin apoprotein domain-containing protein [Streptomyces sp. NPDC052000]|uniref:neocarzinostatin apoprotein domain-containing protein n=1 Tax=Streptomyces sp. NPDC052000 TaxID=3155676 RepID=UPI00344CAD15